MSATMNAAGLTDREHVREKRTRKTHTTCFGGWLNDSRKYIYERTLTHVHCVSSGQTTWHNVHAISTFS